MRNRFFSQIDQQGMDQINPVANLNDARLYQNDNPLLVYDNRLTSFATQVVISSLNGNEDGGYFFEFLIQNPATFATNYFLYVNGDTTATNYRRYRLFVTGAAPGGDSALDSLLDTTATATDLIQGVSTIIPAAGGNVLFESSWFRFAAAGNYHMTSSILYNVNVNLTSLTIAGSLANSIGSASRFRLWKRK